jgi:signal transduction histidine kinase
MNAVNLETLQHHSALNMILSKIIADQKPMIISDASVDTRLAEVTNAFDVRTFIGIPILHRNHTSGVLSIFGDKMHPVPADEIRLLEIIAGQIGIAIENNRLRDQAERLAITEERNRLARELHDSVTQSIYSLTLFAETANRMLETGNLTETSRCLNEIAESSQQALKEMRLLVYKLRPSGYKMGGLVEAIEHRLRSVEGRAGIKFDFRSDKSFSPRAEIEIALYSIAIEALNNSLKYARANQVRVVLTYRGTAASLEIADNGVGFDLVEARQSGGMGLASLNQRVAELQGDLQIESSPGRGTTIRVLIPD